MEPIKLISALYSTALLVMSGSVCSKQLNDQKTAAISFIAGAALSILINSVVLKSKKTRKVGSEINLGSTLAVSWLSLALKYKLFFDRLTLIKPSLSWSESGFYAVSTLVGWKFAFSK